MGKTGGIIFLPIIMLGLFFAAILEPTFSGELGWLWWVLGLLGAFSVFGWGLGKAR